MPSIPISAIDRIPSDRNFFLPVQAEMTVARLPGVEFFCQRVVLPGVSIGSVDQHTPFTPIRKAGDVVSFEEFSVEFMVDEQMTNYLSIWNWIIALGFPHDYSQYAALEEAPRWADQGPQSDCSIFFIDSRGHAVKEAQFRDAFPVSLTPVEVDTRMTDTQFVTTTARFAYTSFKLVDAE